MRRVHIRVKMEGVRPEKRAEGRESGGLPRRGDKARKMCNASMGPDHKYGES